MTYIKENITKKLQKLYSPPRNPRAGNESPALFVKKPLCKGDLSPVHKIFIERPDKCQTEILRCAHLLHMCVIFYFTGYCYSIDYPALLVFDI